MYREAGADPGPMWQVRLMGALRRLVDGNKRVCEMEVGVEDPAIQAQKAVDRRFPVESASALADFHRELVEDGTISEQAAVTYGLRFLEHMLGVIPWDTDEDEDEDE